MTVLPAVVMLSEMCTLHVHAHTHTHTRPYKHDYFHAATDTLYVNEI